MTLGGRLKEARLRRNWTQQLAAEKAGLSESSIKKVESGSPRISVSAYLSLLDVYGLPKAFDHVILFGVQAFEAIQALAASLFHVNLFRKSDECSKIHSRADI